VSKIEELFSKTGAVIVSITKSDLGFQANIRQLDRGWQCAQSYHSTPDLAIAEHVAITDLSELLT
jgi:hypothetical protein